MDSREQIIQELRKEVDILKRQYESLKNASDIDPEIVRAVSLVLAKTYDDVVTDYDRSVNESGASSYTVAKVHDGLFIINGKVVGYYNPV